MEGAPWGSGISAGRPASRVILRPCPGVKPCRCLLLLLLDRSVSPVPLARGTVWEYRESYTEALGEVDSTTEDVTRFEVRGSAERPYISQTGGADPSSGPVEAGEGWIRLTPWTGEDALPLPLDVGRLGPRVGGWRGLDRGGRGGGHRARRHLQRAALRPARAPGSSRCCGSPRAWEWSGKPRAPGTRPGGGPRSSACCCGVDQPRGNARTARSRPVEPVEVDVLALGGQGGQELLQAFERLVGEGLEVVADGPHLLPLALALRARS